MKQPILFLLFTFYFLLFKVNAQLDTSNHKTKDSITVNKDPRLNILIQKQAIINKRAQSQLSTGLYKGYRLQLLSSNDRNQAFKLKYALMNKFPEHKSYVVYQAPYFKVRIGNFMKKEEAEKARKQLAKNFSSGIYIVEDAVEFKHSNLEQSDIK
jgi:septal ring-binding cell division protein DamX